MSVTASVALTLSVAETIGTDAASAVSTTRNSVTYDALGVTSVSIGAATTPTANTHAVGVATLSGGAVTLDLTSLTGLNGVTVSLSGKTPRAILLKNPSTNANAITVAKGASNGYTGLGASYSQTIQPGETVLIYKWTAGTAVSGSVKTLDLTGTASQALSYEIVAG